MPTLDVHFLPSLTSPEALSGATVVVIDVLRATTSIAAALAAGAKEVIPCMEVEEARQVAALFPSQSVILGGERGGERIPGFDLGNSPLEYNAAGVAGKSVVFTTTNGTRALQQCRLASRVWLGALVNLSTISQRVSHDESVQLICAGTDGRITAEDVLCAGLLCDRMVAADRRRGIQRTMSDSAAIARGFAAVCHSESSSHEFARRRLLSASRGGIHLISLGMSADIRVAARLNVLRVAPRLDLDTWRIRSD